MATTGLLALWSGLGLLGLQAGPATQAGREPQVRPYPSGVLEGRVLDAATQQPVENAVVVLVDDPNSAGALTDRDGEYRLPNVPPGRVRLRASRPGFATLEVELSVPRDARLAVDFLLPLDPVTLPTLHARGEPGERPDGAGSATSRTAAPGVRVLDASPGVSELGLLAAARALRTPDPGDPGELLFVRTAGAQLDLVLLNGAPVHAPYHLGGLLDPLSTDVIGSIAVYRGGASARYDGGLSDLVRIESRPGVPGRFRTSGHVDMASAGAYAEGGTDAVSVIGAARVVHGEGSRLLEMGELPQGYADLLLRADVATGEESSLAATVFWNRESVDLALPDAAEGTARWGNTAGSLRYGDSIGAAWLDVTAGLGEFATRLPLGGERDVVAEGRSRRARLAADLGTRVAGVLLGTGVHFDHVGLLNDFVALYPPGAGVSRLRFESSGTSAAGYVDASWSASEEVILGGGVRATTFTFARGLHIAPRARVSWRTSPDLTLTLSAGGHHQVVPAPDSTIDLGTAFLTEEEEPAGIGSSFNRLRVAEASHLAVGVEHDATMGVELGVDGYWETLRGVPGLEGREVTHAGMDLSVRRIDERFRVWATYTMAWAWAHAKTRIPVEISGHHFIRAGALARIAGPVELAGDVSFGDGLSFGAIPRTPISSPLATPGPDRAGDGAPHVTSNRAHRTNVTFVPDPNRSYLRLNVQVTAPWTTELFDRTTELRPYIRVFNVLGRRDALFYHFDPLADGGPRPVGTLPVLPVIGLEWRL